MIDIGSHKMLARKRLMLGVVMTVMLVVSGCGSSGDSAADGSATDSAANVTVTPEMAEMLAKADALDGQVDKVVTLCAPCSLGMDGLEEHSLQVGDYTMWFCKDYCKQRFSEDIPKSVLKMKVPEE